MTVIGDPTHSPEQNAMDLITAITNATPGSTLTLNHLVTFKGNFNLPNITNPNGQYITITSDATANLPSIDPDQPWAGQIIPAIHAQYMPKIAANTTVSPAFWTSEGASYWKLWGLEILPVDANQDTRYFLLRLDYTNSGGGGDSRISYGPTLVITSGAICPSCTQSTDTTTATVTIQSTVGLQVGDLVVINLGAVEQRDSQNNLLDVGQETVTVTAIPSGTTFTAVFKKHQANATVNFNQHILSGAIAANTDATITVSSTAGIVVGAPVIINPNSADQELVFVEQIVSSTQLRAFFTQSHASNSFINADLPHHIIFDQCYIHCWPKNQSGPVTAGQMIGKGIVANTGYFAIFRSYIADIKTDGVDRTESHGINAYNGPGPFLVINNYIEASTENIMFGGSGPTWVVIPGQVIDPNTGYGIFVRYNTFTKQLQWNPAHPSYIAPGTFILGSPTEWQTKNLFEFKSAKNALVDRNFFQYCWKGSQDGEWMLINLANYSRSGIERVQNITVTNNWVDSVGAGFQFAYQDPVSNSNQIINNITVTGNLITNIGWQYSAAYAQCYLFSGAQTVTIANNTMVQDPNTVLGMAACIKSLSGVSGLSPNPLGTNVAITGFVFRNNIMPAGFNGFVELDDSQTYPFTVVFALQLLIPIMQLHEQTRTEVVSTVPTSATAC